MHGQSFGHEPPGRCRHPCAPTDSSLVPLPTRCSPPMHCQVMPAAFPSRRRTSLPGCMRILTTKAQVPCLPNGHCASSHPCYVRKGRCPGKNGGTNCHTGTFANSAARGLYISKRVRAQGRHQRHSLWRLRCRPQPPAKLAAPAPPRGRGQPGVVEGSQLGLGAAGLGAEPFGSGEQG